MKRKTVKYILAKKKKDEKIVMLTAYDYPFAQLVDAAGVDIVLVGDSLANVVLGLESTRDVGMNEMIHHAKAVNRAVKQAMLVGDMPYGSYRDPKTAVKNAQRFVKEAGCDAVKLEWADNCPVVTQAIVKAGIPVMGHVGLTPQTVNPKDGFKLQGKDAEAAEKIINQAKILQTKGSFSIVLECIPDKIAAIVTRKLKIPTIGIGAGASCDGQVLVTYDLLGLFHGFYPKFVKQYVDAHHLISEGIVRFRQDVESGKFPDAAHSYTMKDDELRKLHG